MTRDQAFSRTTSLHSSSPSTQKSADVEFSLDPSQAIPRCPDCGEPLKKRYAGTQHGRKSGVQWECHNPKCSVIFLEKPQYGKKRIVRDAIMSSPKTVKVKLPETIISEMMVKVRETNPKISIGKLIAASVILGVPQLERLEPFQIVELLERECVFG